MQQPEAYLSQADALFDAAGAPTARCTELLQRFVDGYVDWVLRF
jgi:chromate reductase